MFAKYRRRLHAARVKPGDGSALQEYRYWQLFSRSLYALQLDGHSFEVDVRLMRDSTSRKRPAALYRDGVQISSANLPVAFPVLGGVIEVATSQYGLKRMQYVSDDGSAYPLRPHPRSQEGMRARFGERFPRTSAAVGVASVAVLVVGLAVSLFVAAEALTRVPAVAAHIGVFTLPFHLPGWLKAALPIAGAVAATERALMLRSRWMIGG